MKNWLGNFLTSSLGKKVVMSLTGIFLILFLVVHLSGNLQLLYGDQGQAFNTYADFMQHNPLIQTVSLLLYFFIILHAVQGLVIYFQNKSARGNEGYRKFKPQGKSWASRQMAILGTLVLAFLFLHMGDFWYTMKFGDPEMITYAGVAEPVQDLYKEVQITFSNIWFVIAYLVGLTALAFHLWHGFWSAFQTLGIQHDKYTPLIKTIGYIFSIVVPIGFAIIPITMYLQSQA